jgi:large subunit ribosomal protein L27e
MYNQSHPLLSYTLPSLFNSMTKFLKPGKVVVVLQGRYAGKKAVIVKVIEDGNRDREFGHCLIAGVAREPRRVTKSMSKKKILKRSKVKPFVKFVNFNHIMPTRYTISDLDLKSLVTSEAMKKADSKKTARKEVKKVFEERYIERSVNNASVQFFFSKLRF